MDKKELSVIIPSYLEGENLKIILPKLNKILKEIVKDYEVLIVDTMTAMDNTALVCKENGVLYINRIGGNNYGDAVRTGIDKANSIYTIFMNADGLHEPEFIKKLYDNKIGNDVVIASRYVEGGSSHSNKISLFLSVVLNIICSVILGLKCKDISHSFKLYKTADLKNLILKGKNFDIIEEILFKIKKVKSDIKIKEIPFVFDERMFGDTKRNLFIFGITYIITIIRLRFSK